MTQELEALNRRFAQLSSVILERKNIVNVLIQNWKRKQQVIIILNFYYTKLFFYGTFLFENNVSFNSKKNLIHTFSELKILKIWANFLEIFFF